jgi:chemotaxis methyl-accepting protein methylase
MGVPPAPRLGSRNLTKRMFRQNIGTYLECQQILTKNSPSKQDINDSFKQFTTNSSIFFLKNHPTNII